MVEPDININNIKKDDLVMPTGLRTLKIHPIFTNKRIDDN